MRVVTMPYDIHVMGNLIPNNEDIRKSIQVTGGFEIDMLKLICQVRSTFFKLHYILPQELICTVYYPISEVRLPVGLFQSARLRLGSRPKRAFRHRKGHCG